MVTCSPLVFFTSAPRTRKDKISIVCAKFSALPRFFVKKIYKINILYDALVIKY